MTEYSERIFGSEQCAVLYLNADLLKSVKLKPGNKVKIIPEKEGFRVQADSPSPGGPAE